MTAARATTPTAAAARPRHWVALLVAAPAVLVWGNLVVPALPGGPATRAALNLGVVAALTAAARVGGVSWPELGVSHASWRRGAAWGAAAVTVAAAGYALALAVPALRPLVLDSPSAAGTRSELLLRALLVVPLGTVLCEELVFRGVLFALARRVLGERALLGVLAAVFAGWHLTDGLSRPVGGLTAGAGLASVALVLAVTGLGGALMALVRLRTDSLLAPVGVHLGTNAVGLVAVLLATS